MFHRSAHIWLLRPSHTLYTWLSSQSVSPTLASRRTTLWTALPMPMGGTICHRVVARRDFVQQPRRVRLLWEADAPCNRFIDRSNYKPHLIKAARRRLS